MNSRSKLLLAIAFVAFVSLGLPDGILGVAWPSIRGTFGVELTGLGVLLTAMVAGTLISSASTGRILARRSVGWLLMLSSILMAASSATFALGPAWWLLIVAAGIAGLGSGAIDAGLNAYAATQFAPSHVNWLHACYGIGALLGPALMTAVLAAKLSWRWGYAILAMVLAILGVCFAATQGLWHRQHVAEKAKPASPRLLELLGRARLRRQMAMFFVYTGLEATAGQWSYTVMTEGRGVRPEVAGIGVTLYWASLTAGRLAFGALAVRFRAELLLRLALAGAPIATVLFALAPSPMTGLAALGMLGFLLAPVYPILMALTPERVGLEAAASAIGFQVSTAYLGVAALPALAGVAARAAGLEVVGPILLIEALLLLALHEVGWPSGGTDVVSGTAPGLAPSVSDDPRCVNTASSTRLR